MKLINQLLHDTRGTSSVEYGLICALIFLAIVGSISALGNTNTGGFARTVEKLSTAIQAAIGG